MVGFPGIATCGRLPRRISSSSRCWRCLDSWHFGSAFLSFPKKCPQKDIKSWIRSPASKGGILNGLKRDSLPQNGIVILVVTIESWVGGRSNIHIYRTYVSTFRFPMTSTGHHPFLTTPYKAIFLFNIPPSTHQCRPGPSPTHPTPSVKDPSLTNRNVVLVTAKPDQNMRRDLCFHWIIGFHVVDFSDKNGATISGCSSRSPMGN